MELGRELHEARLAHGLSLRVVGRAAALSASQISRVERGEVANVALVQLARLLEVVGLELSAKAFPGSGPLRDSAHAALLARLRAHLPAGTGWRTEVPFPLPGDRRAWDAVIRLDGIVIGVEAETRPRDLQALDRRLNLKRRDGGIDRVVLLLAATRHNRDLIRDHAAGLASSFPVNGRDALDALSHGKDPGGSAILLA
jgi:transcriptional regulator with XRE-family HTH domain